MRQARNGREMAEKQSAHGLEVEEVQVFVRQLNRHAALTYHGSCPLGLVKQARQ